MAKGNMSHPYFPRDLHLPNYKPNDNSIMEILTMFFGVVAVVLVLTMLFLSRHKMSLLVKMKLCWFISCALIHFILEGYFSVFHKTLVGEQTYLAQMWKEYSIGDSRYVSQDTFMVCMETITAFIDGPLAFLAFFAFLVNSPHRYVVQLVLSLCQLYGDTLYFMTAYKDNFIHGEMYHPLYFWFYFVTLNMLWIIIPLLLIWDSWVNLSKAQAGFDRSYSKKKM